MTEVSEFLEFETCKFRSVSKIVKKTCCSSRKVEGYTCNLKKIFPLSPISHCQECKSFKSQYHKI
jgi:hypothetical protein